MKQYFTKNLLMLFMSVFCLPLFGQTTLVSSGDTWNYYYNASAPANDGQGDTWKQNAYNDSGWSSGPSKLGNDQSPSTSVGNNPVQYTTYFRHTFNVADASAYANISLRAIRDDGIVVYLNGTEIWRDHMPSGTISHGTLASNPAVGGADETTWFTSGDLSNSLISGSNTIAVEVHQQATTSSDLIFDLELIANAAVPPSGSDLIAEGSAWKYLDNGSNQGTAWKANGFNDASWASGNAQLGFGDGDEATVISDVNQITNYFRKTITVTAAQAASATLNLEAIRDDGMVVYINGTEVWRDYMPAGTINYNTLATTFVPDDGNTWQTNSITNSLVVGTNVIAVEIHQNSATSSDVSFDFKMAVEGGAPPVSNDIVDADEVWKYLDNGSDQGTSWRAIGFNDASWSSGAAELGYGDGGEATVVGYGPNASSKYPTTYFRKTFNVADPSQYDYLEMEAIRDDGMVVYLNGVEVWRDHISGTVNYQTLADNPAIGGADETTWISQIVVNSLVTGTNVLAVEIHQQALNSSDLSFNFKLSGTTSTPGAVNVDRGPYLQKGTPSSMVIKWRTATPTESVVNYGTSLGNLSQSASHLVPKTEHEIEITGLASNTVYYYEIANATAVLVGQASDVYFKTHPTIGSSQPFTFWALGDAGTANQDQRNVRNAYYNYIGSNVTDGILFLGDNAYNSGTDSEYQNAMFENMYEDKLKNSVAWSTLGNHDGYSADSNSQTGPYYDIFTFPKAGESGGLASGTEAYYSFDYGNVHFIVLDSYETDRSVGGTMYNWAQSDIQNTTQEWIVGVWHHPPYTKGSHNSDTETELVQMRQNFLPMLESNGVDLVLSGHSHSYERSYFLNEHYGTSGSFNSNNNTIGANGDGDGKIDGNGAYLKDASAPEGAVYITAGSSGKISGGSLNHNAMYASLNQLGSCILEVDGNTLNLKFIRETGAIADYFTIQKTNSDPTWYQDLDSDNFGNPAISQVSATQPAGYVSDNTDCDDNEALAFPGNTEVLYDGIDNDCNPATLDTLDADGDGENSDTDCDDTNPAVNASATEILYNGIDDDCNPATPDTLDADGDGENSDTDCDDTNPAINSSATEILYNGIDDDCNPATPDTVDADGDGENSDTDCDDTNPAVNSLATEIPNNGIDDDCNPATPDVPAIVDFDGDGYYSDVDCNDDDAAVNPGATEVLYNGIDDDCNPATLDTVDADGDGENSDTDCDDTNPAINSSATEILYNDIDDDCNPATLDTVDADGDGENSDTDCDDTNPAVNSSATEILYNGIDDDCNPATPDTVDADGDGENSDTDCDDTNPAVNSSATEILYNGNDDDCNPATPDTVDADGDGVNSDTDPDDSDPCVPNSNTPECNPCGDIIFDGFENGFGNWNNGGSDCSRVADNANTGSYSIRLRDNSSSSVTVSDAMDLSSFAQVSFQFSFYAESMENNENFFLEKSTNGGSSYSIVQNWIRGTHFNNNTRYQENVTVNGPFSNNTVFRLRCDASANNDLIFIDDVLITSCTGQAALKTAFSKETKVEDLVTDEPVQSAIKVYPNPASQMLYIECSALKGKEATISLFNITGQLIRNVKLEGDYSHLQEVDLNRFEAGLYILRMNDNKGRVLKIDRVVISK